MTDQELTDFYLSRKQSMVYHAFRFLKNHEDAEDAVQESFVVALCGKFRQEGSLGGFLHRVLVYCCLHRLRDQRTMPTDPLIRDIASNPDHPDRIEAEIIVNQGLARIHPRWRRALNGWMECGGSQGNKPTGLNNEDLHRAKRALASAIDPCYPARKSAHNFRSISRTSQSPESPRVSPAPSASREFSRASHSRME